MPNSGGPKGESVSELDQLKEKYKQRLDQYDRDEESLRKQNRLFKRMLLRVSLAAEGQSGELDGVLSQLREFLRKGEPSEDELSRWMERIEQVVLKLDEVVAGPENPLHDRLELMVRELLSLEISTDKKRELKDFAKQIKRQRERLQETPLLLAEFASIQQRAIQEQLQTGSGKKASAGLLNKLMGNRGERSDSSDAADVQTSISIAGEMMTPKSEASRAFSEEEVELDGAAEEVTNADQMAGHINATLDNLRQQLSYAEQASTQDGSVLEEIANAEVTDDVCDNVDEIAALVLRALSKAQKEFAQYLQTIENRLQFFQSFLNDSQSHQGHRVETDELLYSTIRGQVGSLNREVESASSLSELKLSVSNRLDSLLSTLAVAAKNDSVREASLKIELDRAQEKLQEIESESSAIKMRLQAERARTLLDPLTKLPNREAYSDQFELLFAESREDNLPMVVALADIDHFKIINHRYGHAAGDRVIKLIARELRAYIRERDFLARVGGGEFAILMPDTDLLVAQAVLDRARAMVSRLPFRFRKKSVKITTSMGAASTMDFATKESLVIAADTAIYNAKKGGRNALVVANGSAEIFLKGERDE